MRFLQRNAQSLVSCILRMSLAHLPVICAQVFSLSMNRLVWLRIIRDLDPRSHEDVKIYARLSIELATRAKKGRKLSPPFHRNVLRLLYLYPITGVDLLSRSHDDRGRRSFLYVKHDEFAHDFT